jgi:CheY-like chemotaxis protein
MWSDRSTEAVGSAVQVLIVEDELGTRNTLAALLAAIGYTTHAVGSAELALERLAEGDVPEIALVDLDLPGMNGAEFIEQLATRQPCVFPVLITAASPDRVASLLASDVLHLRKPLDFKELLRILEDRGRSV